MTRYEISKRLGRGGYGEVFLARTEDGEQVAVKLLHEEVHTAPGALARLHDEAEILASLDHPGIVAARALVRLDGRLALVTEYVEGTDLARFCRDGRRLPERCAAEVAARIADVLDALHARRLIHRDIKPANVRLTRAGGVKVLDFGIAKGAGLTRWARTQTGRIPFTVGYTPPEAFSTGEQGPPTDLFSLGVTLLRVLVGVRLFGGASLVEQAAICRARRRYEAQLAERIALLAGRDPSLIALVGGCLAWDPGARPSASAARALAEEAFSRLAGPTLGEWLAAEPPVEEAATELFPRVLVADREEPSGYEPALERLPRRGAWRWAAGLALIVGGAGLALVVAVALAQAGPPEWGSP